jgi:hypothetical protein
MPGMEVKGVRRTFTLKLSRFSRDELAEQADRDGMPLARVLSLAALYFASDLMRARLAARLPRFKEGLTEEDGEALQVTLELDDEVWGAVDDYALRENVPVERVLEHAAVYYLADLHSGRMTRRLADADGGT